MISTNTRFEAEQQPGATTLPALVAITRIAICITNVVGRGGLKGGVGGGGGGKSGAKTKHNYTISYKYLYNGNDKCCKWAWKCNAPVDVALSKSKMYA